MEETAGLAPPPFQNEPELQVSRRIERGVGSAFRVNGREARARDVQTLFADLASGARASSMVSQGRVAAIVSARPDERRAVLEEAAGITGLHARRHEAELKLRAAEANLARAEDLRGQMEAQLAGLKRQARQASRYRNLSGHVREAEAELLAIQRAAAGAGAGGGGGGAAPRARRGGGGGGGGDRGVGAARPRPRPHCRRCAARRRTRARRWSGTGWRRRAAPPRRRGRAPHWPRPRRGCGRSRAISATPSSLPATPPRPTRGSPRRTRRWPRPRRRCRSVSRWRRRG